MIEVKKNDEERYSPENTIIITKRETDGNETLCINHRHNQYLPRRNIDDRHCQSYSTQETEYLIQSSGVLSDIKHVVDTTGAGDAFIGGYLLALLASNDKENQRHDHRSFETPTVQQVQQQQLTAFAMNFGSWVAGKKLQGPGARDALPRGRDVDDELGSSAEEIEEKLKTTICFFPARDSTVKNFQLGEV